LTPHPGCPQQPQIHSSESSHGHCRPPYSPREGPGDARTRGAATCGASWSFGSGGSPPPPAAVMDPVCMGAAAARVLEMRAEVRAACGRSDLRGQHQRPEPASLTRILVEAESAGTPFVLLQYGRARR
ncbi:unnamed protein product, partial [Urochloa humidicola]